jgi:hypothetical protein
MEIEPLHRQKRRTDMRIVRRIECAAEESDAHSGTVCGQPHAHRIAMRFRPLLQERVAMRRD